MSQKSAELIKNFLKEHNLSIAEFARIADISRFSVYKYLAGGNIQRKVAKRMEVNIYQEFRAFLPHEKLIE